MTAINIAKTEKQISHMIKYEFDKVKFKSLFKFAGFGWNCIVGRNFGSQVTHQTKKYIFFSIKELNFLLWKA